MQHENAANNHTQPNPNPDWTRPKVSPETALELRRVLEQTEGRIDDAEAELAAMRRQADAIRGLLAIEEPLADGEPKEDEAVQEAASAGAKSKIPPYNPKSFSSQLRYAIFRVLANERPLHRDDILERVEDQGLVVPPTKNKKPVNQVGNALSREEMFCNYNGMQGWWTLTEELEQDIPLPKDGKLFD